MPKKNLQIALSLIDRDPLPPRKPPGKALTIDVPTIMTERKWTIRELATASGAKHEFVRRRIILRSGVIRLGRTYAIPDSVARQFVEELLIA